MADKYPVRKMGPLVDIRPRATPNAEINAQKRDRWRYDEGVYEEPPVKDVPLRGYARGGKVPTQNRFGFATPGKYTKR